RRVLEPRRDRFEPPRVASQRFVQRPHEAEVHLWLFLGSPCAFASERGHDERSSCARRHGQEESSWIQVTVSPSSVHGPRYAGTRCGTKDCTLTPVLVVLVSISRNALGIDPLPKSRSPCPRTTGKVHRRYSSISPRLCSDRASGRLPCTCSSSP